ncbi:ABC transporter ATP-binding protein [Oscillospiraceae bacterium MB08-C2-2]|nr:ABC transporter ATP-binding protein [Oscillospiraceae bacterium MB08-C2-2]
MTEIQKPVTGRLLSVMSAQWPKILMALLCAVVSSLSAIFATLYLGYAIDAMVGQGDVDFPGLHRIILILGGLYLAGALFQWFVSVLANQIAHGTSQTLRHLTFEKLGRLPLSFFDQTSRGDLVSRFTNDLDSVSLALSLSIVSLFTGAVVVVTSLIFMLSLNVQITLVILLCTPVIFLVAWIISRFTQETYRRQQAVVGELSGFVSEIVGNQRLVTAFGYESRSVERFEAITARLKVTGTKAHFASALFNPITRFVDHLTYLLVGVVGGLIALGGVSVGTVSSFLIYSAQFAKPFNEISGVLGNIQTAFASLRRIFEILDTPEESAEAPNMPELGHPQGAVEFRNVDFSYSSSRPLIQDLNLKVTPGSLVAIVGPTGAGKTTIVNLLMRFYELNKGALLIDGRNVSGVTRNSLRRSFGMVLQDTWLFEGTIRDNIAYGKPNATQQEVEEAARFAHAHSFIKRLPQQYDTMLTQDGGNLSQGQKQLLTIARVMLTNPAMLILDEATSSIDTLTEIRIQKAFLKMMEGRTSFVIAHRLSTITSADVILVLDKGKIIETGTHNELLEKGGFYAQLYASQFQ